MSAAIVIADATLKESHKAAENEIKKAMVAAEMRRQLGQKAVHSIVDNITTQQKREQQQEWFRQNGHCLQCGEKLNFLDRVRRREQCQECQKLEASRHGRYGLPDFELDQRMSDAARRMAIFTVHTGQTNKIAALPWKKLKRKNSDAVWM